MKLWEFIIEDFHDLGPFGDLLEEHSHPGYTVVRWLIADNKFPYESHRPRGEVFSWCPEELGYHVIISTKDSGELSNQLPTGLLKRGHEAFYHTATEAIWAVVNAWLYNRGSTKNPIPRDHS